MVRKSWNRTLIVTVRPASRLARRRAATASAIRTSLDRERGRGRCGRRRRSPRGSTDFTGARAPPAGRRWRGRGGAGAGRARRRARSRASPRSRSARSPTVCTPRRSSTFWVCGPTPHSARTRQRVEERQLLAGRDDQDAGAEPRSGRRRLRLRRLRRQLGQELGAARRPTEQVSPSSSSTVPADAGGDLGGRSPSRRVAPPTSRNASSRLERLDQRRDAAEDRHDPPGHLGVVGVVAGQEHGVRAQPPGPHRRHRRVHAVGPGLVARGGDDTPGARRRRRPPACPRSSGCRSSSTDAKNASMSTWRMWAAVTSARSLTALTARTARRWR